MKKTSIDDQIDKINELIKGQPEIYHALELNKKVLSAQKYIFDKYNDDILLNWDNKISIEDLQIDSIRNDQPILSYIDSNILNSEIIIKIIEQLIRVIFNQNKEDHWTNKFLSDLKRDEKSIYNLIKASFKGDSKFFEEYANKFEVSPASILFILDYSIQPFIKELNKKVHLSFFERMWKSPCPFCGRIPVVARLRSRKRYLVCPLCDSIYLTDIFFCVNCGNLDPNTLKFLIIKDTPELRIDFCEKCKHYIKVIDEDRLKKPIPIGLEDIMTLDLDFIAKNQGLKR